MGNICDPCQEFSQIPICFSSMFIGTLDINQAYYFYLKDLTTGRVSRSPFTTNAIGDGVVTLAEQPLIGHSYEFWVTFAGNSMNSRVEITLGAVTYCCGSFAAESIKDQSFTEITFGTITLTTSLICS